jgi:SpoVK/Ycf46/Vps4 family AAA+-type ATPase
MNVRHVLDYAKGVQCVLLLDELDALAKRRDDASDVGELKRLVTVLLQEIDDWPASGLLVAATNHPDLLDPAVWRRFGMVVEFPMPDVTQVQTAITTFLGPDAENVEHLRTALGVLLQGESFSDIERALLRSRREAVVHGEALEARIEQLIRVRVTELSANDRRRLAAELSKAGVPQRQCTELTGVSRDTIRRRVAEAPQ